MIILVSVNLATEVNGAVSTSEELTEERMTFIRHGFYESVESHSKTDRMIEYIESTFTEEFIFNEPVLLAYYGALNALKAKHVFNPFSKISYLRSALRKLEEATYEGACKIEVRFLRFSVLHNIPSFLGYREELENETNAVYELLLVDEQYRDLDHRMTLNVIEFILESNRFDEERHQQLQSLEKQLKVNEHVSTD